MKTKGTFGPLSLRDSRAKVTTRRKLASLRVCSQRRRCRLGLKRRASGSLILRHDLDGLSRPEPAQS